MRIRWNSGLAGALAVVVWSGLAGQALAHASEQGLVLLLPTKVYIAAGTATVVLSLLLVMALPAASLHALYRTLRVMRRPPPALAAGVSLISSLFIVVMILAGIFGPRDPLHNPLPLTIWTIWWIGLVVAQGVFGDLWRALNPWSGLLGLIRRRTGLRARWRLTRRMGRTCALGSYLGLALVLLADPAPADPDRLAAYVALYWGGTLIAGLLFGPRWLVCAEGITVMMRYLARVAPLGRCGPHLALGLPGWKILSRSAPGPLAALFMLVMLAVGSFDGLNETFWWFGHLGINPLEFPGRSAVIAQNSLGLVAAILALLLVYAVTLWIGQRLARDDRSLFATMCLYAPSLLPIALGYHFAHYLTSFRVEIQYVQLFLSDPFHTGADYLGLGRHYVTTSFFNTPNSVRAIWLSQAGAVVLGHVLALMLAHALAVRAYGETRRATLAQVPLALFMIAYTLFGLWLLASPRGV